MMRLGDGGEVGCTKVTARKNDRCALRFKVRLLLHLIVLLLPGAATLALAVVDGLGPVVTVPLAIV